MNSFNEKEKKLRDALEKLKNFEVKDERNIEQVKVLKEKKNQLEIENSTLEKKYSYILDKYEDLELKLKYFEKQKNEEIKKEKKFDEKIDELNQETDILINEIDKWQI
tara:strand:+ start:63 stop:386 length:324 start_codon:yes stop_codon:yes gene_type:complete